MKFYFKSFIALIFSLFFFSSCIYRGVAKKKAIVYDAASEQKLDVYYPKKELDKKKDVLLFIHGGNWRSGNRKMYRFFGKRFAEKGIVCVVIDYRLSDKQNYVGMANDCTNAVKWTHKNIARFGGDSSSIFLGGHSAGGHLAALVTYDKEFLAQKSSLIPGVLLIDPFGLDMYHYLTTVKSKYNKIYEPTFSTDSVVWKKGSPINYISGSKTPCILLVGTKTFPAIKDDVKRFHEAIVKEQPSTRVFEVKGKGHFQMIGMFNKKRNPYFKTLLDFINENHQK
jgi:acetyl esterase/lipase